jgi:hypothetical protein
MASINQEFSVYGPLPVRRWVATNSTRRVASNHARGKPRSSHAARLPCALKSQYTQTLHEIPNGNADSAGSYSFTWGVLSAEVDATKLKPARTTDTIAKTLKEGFFTVESYPGRRHQASAPLVLLAAFIRSWSTISISELPRRDHKFG